MTAARMLVPNADVLAVSVETSVSVPTVLVSNAAAAGVPAARTTGRCTSSEDPPFQGVRAPLAGRPSRRRCLVDWRRRLALVARV